MANNYNIIAEYLTQKYIERICGNDIDETFVDMDPAHRVMVGMMSEDRIQQTLSGGYEENISTKFESIPSISVSFHVKKNKSGVLRIVPKGYLFYTVRPDYKKTVDYILEYYSERDKDVYTSIQQLQDLYPDEQFNFPLTYKKKSIEKEIGEGIAINLDSLKDQQFHLGEAISQRLSFLETEIADEVRIVNATRIPFSSLLSEDSFQLVSGVSEEKSRPQWLIDVYCTVKDCGDEYSFLLQMVNKTATAIGENSPGYIPKIFNAGLDVVGNEYTEFCEIKLDYFNSSFHQREKVYAIAENTSCGFDAERNRIYTENVPVFRQYRLNTKDSFREATNFENLIRDPEKNLMEIFQAMQKDYEICSEEGRKTDFASKAAKRKFNNALDEYKNEIYRFKSGIDQIKYKDHVRKAFQYMNQTFSTKLDGDSRSYPGWRLFQLVFIVSMIPEMIRSEYKDDSTLVSTDLEFANLLYFPTGGGKTEAFLGCCVFSMFFDRIRGKNEGVTALLKYPLRLLAVQQLDRVLTVVMKANKVKAAVPELSMTNDFAVGFFVGKENTPNKITKEEPLSSRGEKNRPHGLILESDQDTLNEYYRFIDTCPCCGKKIVNIKFDMNSWRLQHVCDNPECKANVLPISIVDDEIYRFLPSIVVSVVDKMALLGTTNEFKALLGQVKGRCQIHGFTVGKKCRCPGCADPMNTGYLRPLKDPVPTLFIQDELHLMTESLGTFASHYESFIDYFAKNLVPERQRKQIRFIGATATIAMYKDHIRELYHMEGRRFPCEYPAVKRGEDFYSYTDYSDVSRILMGYAPYGRSIIEGMWQSAMLLRVICYDMLAKAEDTYKLLCEKGINGARFDGTFDDYQKILYEYWTELIYNNRKDDVLDLNNAFQNQANNLLEAKGMIPYNIEQMTSDEDFQSVRRTLFDIQANRKNREATNLLLATKTISHGVDEDSFNMMYFFGMPNNNAEYIQAYSRVGRKYTGIVIDIIRLMRIRDRSYLKNFVIFHQNKDDLVESVPINRWAKNAVYQSLPGLLSGLIMQYYTTQTGIDSLYFANDVKKLLMNGSIKPDTVAQQLVEIYGCNNGEKLSLAYEEIIREQTHNILSGIQNNNFDPQMFLSNAIGEYAKGRYTPMTSLRDTEESITVDIR